MQPVLTEPPGRLYRVGRVGNPLNFSFIGAADASLLHGGNRFDVPGEGVCYLGTTPRACFAETLARFRPSPRVVAAVRDEDPHFMVSGGVPTDWRAQRLLVECTLEDALPFLDVEAAATHSLLTAVMAEDLVRLGVPELDVPAGRGSSRLLTRAISAWAFDAGDARGDPLYGGIRYMSRLGDHECWAVFGGTEIRETARTPLLLTDPDLGSVADDFGLRIF